MSELDLTTFRENFTVTVARYELYPSDQPTSYCVGFSVKHNTKSDTRYQDTRVLLTDAENKTSNEITQLAWASLQSVILQWANNVVNKSNIVGSTFTI